MVGLDVFSNQRHCPRGRHPSTATSLNWSSIVEPTPVQPIPDRDILVLVVDTLFKSWTVQQLAVWSLVSIRCDERSSGLVRGGPVPARRPGVRMAHRQTIRSVRLQLHGRTGAKC